MVDLTDTPPRARREINRSRTRRDIQHAVREFAHEGLLQEVTAEQVAERAGISRRTFFNYFTGIDAVCSEAITEIALDLISQMVAHGSDQHPIAAMRAVIGAGLPDELLSWMSALGNEHTKTSVPGHWFCDFDRLVQIATDTWGESTTATHPELYFRGLASTIMGAFDAAEHVWRQQTDGSLSTDSVHTLHRLIDEALLNAQSGWANS